MAESRFEKKVIILKIAPEERWDYGATIYRFIALRTDYAEGASDPLTKLLVDTGYRGAYVWLIYVPSGDPEGQGQLFNLREDYWEHKFFRGLHRALRYQWDDFTSGETITPQDTRLEKYAR